MTTTYTYDFADGSELVVTYDETSAQTTNPPNGYAVTSISGTWQNTPVYAVNGQTGNYVNDATGLGYYDNTIFPNLGPTGDGANMAGNLDGIDTAGLLFQLTDENGPLVQLQWDGANANAYTWTSVFVGGTSNGNGSTTISGFTACYAAGTRILTARGEVAVEELRPSDRVMTLTAFGLAEVRWIGHRRVDVRRHPNRASVAPVRVQRDAFAEGRPHRDLLLSPDHSVYVDGVLIPIRYLVNGATVRQEHCENITYYHVELDRHDVLLAEGMPAESYLDTGNRGAFANGGQSVHAHPDFALQIWEARSCAPLVTTGLVLRAVRLALAARARSLGYENTTDPDLSVFADDRKLLIRQDGTNVFVDIPAGTRTVRLVSRTGVPAWTVLESNDHRCLGVAAQGLSLDGIPLRNDVFGRGWYAPEPGLRWTDGNGELRIGCGRLATTLLPLLTYWDAPTTPSTRRAAA